MIMVFPPHLVIPLPPAVVNAVIRGVQLTTVAQYLGAAGLVVLLYDHCLTLGEEINLIYTTPSSFLKWFFMTNHYIVEICLIAIANETSGYNGLIRDDQKFMTAIACFAMISTFVANFIGFLRVVTLWDRSHRIVIGLSITLTISFLVTVACTVASIIYFEPAIRYDPSLKLCYMTESSKPYIVLWATPLVFDITVLAFMVYNSLSNPRDLKTSLRRVLYRDGILFFLLVALIRALNLGFVIAADPALSALPAYFSWAVITLACRRFLFHVHSCEQEVEYYDHLYASRHSQMENDSASAIELYSCKTDRH